MVGALHATNATALILVMGLFGHRSVEALRDER
jgi:hypothetical protein